MDGKLDYHGHPLVDKMNIRMYNNAYHARGSAAVSKIKRLFMTRREARITVMQLLFEADFHKDESPEQIYGLARMAREFPDDDYVKDMFFGISNHQTVLENIIGRYSQNWSAKRISRVSYAAMCISIYEMVKREDIPVKVSINEAVQISKDFDEEKASPFVNGILNSVKDDLESIRHEF